ncbi:U4/U5/U6 small nuclear ribonucleoprotein prp3 [Cyphellophora attinorum]|uniref:U4/U5/U6 small nuclear ribonucleoprotein prp3 n=1 Tax=Cyphellophora attinorum TaxID=1664694 RepID=A0A0N1NZM3_9EURO|nr:U4/U5/U6 small nuclear ribonucleoprotein prp3 [Phialophora attinorum]KPI40536.1 U4/U5/U6 small nuclear ribonucleoprotein prp3 [Phialophora attinorum]
MASTPSSSLKRPHPEDDASSDQKRARSNNGSPRPSTPGTPGAPPKMDVSQIMAQARARAEALKARNAANAPPATTPAASLPTGTSTSDRLAALKARVAAATSRTSTQSTTPLPSHAPPAREDMPRSRGGLDIGMHPLLRDDAQHTAAAGRAQPKFATTLGNRKAQPQIPKKEQLDLTAPSLEELKANPYFDSSIGPANASLRGRKSRQLLFNEQGKYMAQGAALRKQAQLEEMKKRIAESARKAGIDEDLDTERAFLVPEPPAIEWWDEGLVNGDSYDAISNPANLKIDTPDSVVTIYIQFPVALEPPQERNMPAPKPMHLTKTEMAKKRRQQRKANMQEEQAKVRLGLVPPPPPKVTRNNMMRVLGEEAIQDPTAVEARVNREVAARHQTHLDANSARALSKEERHEKLARQQAADESLGIHVRVYKIGSLANGQHRFKISKNAEQDKLTGVCIMNPKFCLLVVEGGAHSINHYDKLMQNRIKWTEIEEPKAVQEGNRAAAEERQQAKWLDAHDEETGELRDLGENKCELIFSGEEKQRAFRKWLGARVCETDGQARDVLARAKMEGMWSVAKSFKRDF